MAKELYLNIQNLEYHIDAITPSNSARREKFRSINSANIEPELVKSRQYSVDFVSSSEATDITDGTLRTTPAIYRVSVYYPWNNFTAKQMYSMMLDDKRDLVYTIEDPAKWIGISGDASAEVGILNRKVIAGKVQQTDTTWVLELDIRTRILEQY